MAEFAAAAAASAAFSTVGHSGMAPGTTTYQNRTLQTTEWEDALVAKGILQERPEVAIMREMQAASRQRTEVEEASAEVQLSAMGAEELEDAEDEFEDDAYQRIRAKRLAEMRAQAATEKYGEVLPLVRADFVREVTEASKSEWVIVELYQNSIEASERMSQVFRAVAARHKATKFMRIIATECIENWPDSRVPCLIVYHDGEMQKQLVGVGYCGGKEALTPDALEWSLSRTGAVRTELEGPPSEGGFSMSRGAAAVKPRRGGQDDEVW